MKKIAHHIPHYLSLFGILAVSALGFYLFKYDKIFQEAITIAAAASYVSWGIVHHAYHEDLYLAVIIEYLLVALLGLVLIFSTLLAA